MALAAVEETRALNTFLDAAKNGDVEAVLGQLEGIGTPVDSCVQPFKRTALHWACEGGHNDVCVVLIEANADVDFKDRVSGSILLMQS